MRQEHGEQEVVGRGWWASQGAAAAGGRVTQAARWRAASHRLQLPAESGGLAQPPGAVVVAGGSGGGHHQGQEAEDDGLGAGRGRDGDLKIGGAGGYQAPPERMLGRWEAATGAHRAIQARLDQSGMRQDSARPSCPGLVSPRHRLHPATHRCAGELQGQEGPTRLAMGRSMAHAPALCQPLPLSPARCASF